MLAQELQTAAMNAKGVFAAERRSMHANGLGLREANEAVAFAVRTAWKGVAGTQ